MRHASVTFDPAAAACDMPASLLTQRPRHATCQPHFRPSGLGMRHAGASADGLCRGREVRPGTWQTWLASLTPPAKFAGVRRRPEAEAVLIGISVRLHLVFASGFLSVCEGKGLYVRRACQYVILRISSPPCTWPECSFCRRPIYCLSAPYASRGVPEIHEP